MGLDMPIMSVSWKASVPIRWEATWPEITTIGIESIKAVAIPVIAFVAPGPDVTRTTPGLPVALAYPSAAWVAPCSCLTRMCCNSFWLNIAS